MSEIAAVAVHIVASDIPIGQQTTKSERHTTFNTLTIPDGVPNNYVQVLKHAPRRKRALLFMVGQSTDVPIICGSQGDAQAQNGAQTMAGPTPIELTGTDEVWVYCATAIKVGVLAEYEREG